MPAPSPDLEIKALSSLVNSILGWVIEIYVDIEVYGLFCLINIVSNSEDIYGSSEALKSLHRKSNSKS
jgi:hypothetical protein